MLPGGGGGGGGEVSGARGGPARTAGWNKVLAGSEWPSPQLERQSPRAAGACLAARHDHTSCATHAPTCVG
jgi:hypothetical protein